MTTKRGAVCRCQFDVVKVTEASEGIVFIVDLDNGGCSVTNDAEAVVSSILAQHPGKRIVYRDSDGYWDELTHDGQKFTGFAVYHDRQP